MPGSSATPRLSLRAEPSRDRVLLEWAPDAAAQRKDVVACEDSELTRVKVRWPWYSTFSKPRRFRKRVRVAGQNFAAVWQDDLPAENGSARSASGLSSGLEEVLDRRPKRRRAGRPGHLEPVIGLFAACGGSG